ncbi:methyl-accepting chemotaxis protein [Alkalihalobacillus sp. MEB130]|uniref:methyl-accepting chemotaxis protein n=1 Tax=Alkalihalobacillus sp. MEB130 TaxID=2976704 RepID=UPI0028DEA6AC|nr:methyl-accepting chemotaxis protein [Alkalihalobacillus sp. MEB130]MDT8862816.1 methyl-accepting chemotaxis protein [Alkalihalobacillus sp. MEB130]
MFKKIQTKIMTLITVMLIVAIFAVGIIAYLQTKNVIENSTRAEASNVAYEITRYTNQYFEAFSNQLTLFSKDERIINYLLEVNGDANLEATSTLGQSISNQFTNYGQLNESIELVYIGGEGKTMDVTPSVDLPDGFDPTSRPWYIEAKENPEEVIWTDPYVTQDGSGDIVITGAKAILDPVSNQLLGVIGFDLSLDALTAIINQVEVNYGGFTALFDANGTALVHPTHTGEDLSGNETIGQMLSGDNSGFIEYHFEGFDRFMFYDTISQLGWKVNVVYIYDEMLGELVDLRNKIVLLSTVLLLLSLVGAYVVSRNIANPIKQLKTHVSKVAAGDLTVKSASASRDEVGQLTIDFNDMVQQMKGLIQSVQRSANEVNESAESLSAISEKTIASSQEVALAVDDIARGSTKQVDDVEETKNRTVVLSDQIEKVTKETFHIEKVSSGTKKISENGTMQVDQLQVKTSEANEVLHNVEEVVTGLYGKIAEIELVIETINGISEQTNLLALNASIEAARAGEHGKGFAVVAQEVRKLAEQSSKATVGVSETISAIITQSEKVKSELTKTKEIFSLQTVAVDDTQAAFNQIVSSVEEIVSSLSMIRMEVETMSSHKDMVIDSIQNIAAVAEEASASVEEVNASSDQQVDALSQIASSAEQLNESSSQLLERIQQFKVEE